MAAIHYNKVACTAATMMIVVVMLTMNGAKGEAVTCKQVASTLTSCLDYIKNGGSPVPPAPCCGGVKSLYAATKASGDRQTVCKCLKTSLANVKVNYDLLGSLPQDCGVNLPYKITPSIDCTSLH